MDGGAREKGRVDVSFALIERGGMNRLAFGLMVGWMNGKEKAKLEEERNLR